MKQTVIPLNELNIILLALALHKVTGLLVGEVPHHLDAVDGAVIHFNKLKLYQN